MSAATSAEKHKLTGDEELTRPIVDKMQAGGWAGLVGQLVLVGRTEGWLGGQQRLAGSCECGVRPNLHRLNAGQPITVHLLAFPCLCAASCVQDCAAAFSALLNVVKCQTVRVPVSGPGATGPGGALGAAAFCTGRSLGALCMHAHECMQAPGRLLAPPTHPPPSPAPGLVPSRSTCRRCAAAAASWRPSSGRCPSGPRSSRGRGAACSRGW